MRTTSALLTGALVGLMLTAPLRRIIPGRSGRQSSLCAVALFDWWAGSARRCHHARDLRQGHSHHDFDLGETSSTPRRSRLMGLLTFLAVGVAAGAGLFAARRAFDGAPG